nr:biopolymer transporter ExbD [uncultured Bacteroides sp.]
MRRFKRTIPDVDADWTGYIVVLLLIFFVVITSMDVDQGLARRLPPPIGKYQPVKVEPRNILNVFLTDTDELICGSQIIGIGQLREVAKAFIANPKDDNRLPEKVTKRIPLLGNMQVTVNHIISVKCGRSTTYQAYIDVQNELIGAYNELRDELAKRKWGKKFIELSFDKQQAVSACYPIRISEAEPQLNIGGEK